MDNDPSYEPIIGGHKTHSWEKELRERGMHASANDVANVGDDFFEGPQGHPAPGSGSPRRDRVSASPARTGSYSPRNMPPASNYTGSPRSQPTPTYHAQLHPSAYASNQGPANQVPPRMSHGGVSPPRGRSGSPTQQPSYQPTHSAPSYSNPPTIHAAQPRSSASPTQQPYATQSAAPSYHETNYAPPQQRTVSSIPPGSDNDQSYEPIIGGHKTHSWEKELRERGMHASANDVANVGDDFFEGPQGHPAPGSGSPRRDRVSASPARTGSYSPRNMPPASFTGSPRSQQQQQPPSYLSTADRPSYPASAGRGPSPTYQSAPVPAPAHEAQSTYSRGPSSGRGPSPSYQPAPASTYQASPASYQQAPPASYQQAPPASYQQAPPASYQQASPTSYQQAPSASYQQAPPALYQQASPTSYQQAPVVPNYASVSPVREGSQGYASQRNASPVPHTPSAVPLGSDNDPSYEPIIGGHKTHSWEKELRERGMHASANEVAASGDHFFEGPQGNPAPGSGSPRRDRVSPSPSRGRSSATAY